jgi:Fe-S-cluster containining protein
MIDFKMLEGAADKTEKSFQTLLKTYEKLPETICGCDNIGVCCVSLPEMTVLEALSWIDTITELPPDERTVLLRKFVYFYLSNPVRRPGCPFRREGSCTIYSRRPFACRAYGLWSRENGAEQTQKNRELQKTMLEMWKQFGVTIPAECLVTEMDYCREVTTHTSASISDNNLLKVLEEVYLLSTPVADLQQLFENAYQSDFSFLITSLILGQKKAFLGKYAVIKEMVTKGSETRLDKFLKATSSDVWCLNFPNWPAG